MGKRTVTKKQIEAMQDAIAGAWVSLRDQGLCLEAWRTGLDEHRLRLVLAGIRERIAWHEHHAAESRGTVAHFQAHPELYGRSTPEMVERFTGLAAKYDKGAAWFRALLERAEADGLPSEVTAFDPTA